MNAPHKAILAHVLRDLFSPDSSNGWTYHEPITDDNAEQALAACEAEGKDYEVWVHEELNEFRTSGSEAPGLGLGTNSRHYESDSVACQLDDGRCVAWTYWHGGGKHGEPESVPWLEDAIFVESHEETVVVRRFTRIETVQS